MTLVFTKNGKTCKFVSDQAEAMPVGATYIQFPDCPEPSDLWGGVWTKLDYKDCFMKLSDEPDSEIEEAGLPNITGYLGPLATHRTYQSQVAYGGAFDCYGEDEDGKHTGGDEQRCWFNFNASRCSSVYGRSTTVTPQNIRVTVWKRVA